MVVRDHRAGGQGHQPLVRADHQPAALVDLPVVGAAHQDKVGQSGATANPQPPPPSARRSIRDVSDEDGVPLPLTRDEAVILFE
jgi:hypothetical protein